MARYEVIGLNYAELRASLKQDLETGAWERRYAELLTLDAYDAGYRLVLADRE